MDLEARTGTVAEELPPMPWGRKTLSAWRMPIVRQEEETSGK